MSKLDGLTLSRRKLHLRQKPCWRTSSKVNSVMLFEKCKYRCFKQIGKDALFTIVWKSHTITSAWTYNTNRISIIDSREKMMHSIHFSCSFKYFSTAHNKLHQPVSTLGRFWDSCGPAPHIYTSCTTKFIKQWCHQLRHISIHHCSSILVCLSKCMRCKPSSKSCKEWILSKSATKVFLLAVSFSYDVQSERLNAKLFFHWK